MEEDRRVIEDRITEEIREWYNRLDHLKTQMELLEAGAKFRAAQHIVQLEHKVAAVERAAHRMRQVDEVRWPYFRSEAERGVEELGASLETVRSWFAPPSSRVPSRGSLTQENGRDAPVGL
ncbi:MAG: hypothetical protein ACM3L6_04535 [Deltaproteobacteria bacterium]